MSNRDIISRRSPPPPRRARRRVRPTVRTAQRSASNGTAPLANNRQHAPWEYLTGQSATVLEADAAADVPSLVAAYLRQNNLPARLAMGDDAYLAALPWNKEPAIERKQGRAQPTDEVGLAHAVAGIAETGTLMLASGADNPVTINFLPETYIGWSRIRTSSAHTRTAGTRSGPASETAPCRAPST
jgi:L-lactate utilization protein LutC